MAKGNARAEKPGKKTADGKKGGRSEPAGPGKATSDGKKATTRTAPPPKSTAGTASPTTPSGQPQPATVTDHIRLGQRVLQDLRLRDAEYLTKHGGAPFGGRRQSKSTTSRHVREAIDQIAALDGVSRDEVVTGLHLAQLLQALKDASAADLVKALESGRLSLPPAEVAKLVRGAGLHGLPAERQGRVVARLRAELGRTV